MLFTTPNQQCQVTEGNPIQYDTFIYANIHNLCPDLWWLCMFRVAAAKVQQNFVCYLHTTYCQFTGDKWQRYFYWPECPSCHLTNSVKALKETQSIDPNQCPDLILSSSTTGLLTEGAPVRQLFDASTTNCSTPCLKNVHHFIF